MTHTYASIHFADTLTLTQCATAFATLERRSDLALPLTQMSRSGILEWLDTVPTRPELVTWLAVALGLAEATLEAALRYTVQSSAWACIEATVWRFGFGRTWDWRADPYFEADDLPASVRRWWDAFVAGVEAPHVSFDWWATFETTWKRDLYVAARSLWFTAAGALFAFLATGSTYCLDVLASVATLITDNLADYDNDGRRELVYQSGAVSQLLIGTDNGMDMGLLVGALCAMAAPLRLNAALSPVYAQAADAIEAWVMGDYLQEVVAENNPQGSTLIDDTMHCSVRGVVFWHFLEKAFGSDALAAMRTAFTRPGQPEIDDKAQRLSWLRQSFIERPNGSLVWDQRVAHPGSRPIMVSPSVYAEDTTLSLALLALEGIYDDSFMHKLANTLTLNVFPNGFNGARDVGGGIILPGEPFTALPDTGSLISPSKFRQAGFPLIAYWDRSGVLATLAQTAQVTTTNELAMPGMMLFVTLAK